MKIRPIEFLLVSQAGMIAAKMVGALTWPWWAVTLPVWGCVAGIVLVFAIAMALLTAAVIALTAVEALVNKSK